MWCLRIASVMALGVLFGVLGLHGPAAAGQKQVQLNRQESGVFAFCLSFEDARVERDARMKAIVDGMSVEQWWKISPNTRCYRNTITFVPLNIEPKLDGMGFVFSPDNRGAYQCPGEGQQNKRCSVSTAATRFILAELLYGKLRFPVYVELADEVLVDEAGKPVPSQ